MNKELKRMGFYEVHNGQFISEYFKRIRHKRYPDFKVVVHVDLKEDLATKFIKEVFEKYKKDLIKVDKKKSFKKYIK